MNPGTKRSERWDRYLGQIGDEPAEFVDELAAFGPGEVERLAGRSTAQRQRQQVVRRHHVAAGEVHYALRRRAGGAEQAVLELPHRLHRPAGHHHRSSSSKAKETKKTNKQTNKTTTIT